jgi:hypothetical protein
MTRIMSTAEMLAALARMTPAELADFMRRYEKMLKQKKS